jgi:hypothetical protein
MLFFMQRLRQQLNAVLQLRKMRKLADKLAGQKRLKLLFDRYVPATFTLYSTHLFQECTRTFFVLVVWCGIVIVAALDPRPSIPST